MLFHYRIFKCYIEIILSPFMKYTNILVILWCLQCGPEGSHSLRFTCQHFSGANCFSAACPNKNVKGPERHKPPFVDMQVPTLVADSWRSSLHWPPPRTLTPPDWSIDCRRFFCIITFFCSREERDRKMAARIDLRQGSETAVSLD